MISPHMSLNHSVLKTQEVYEKDSSLSIYIYIHTHTHTHLFRRSKVSLAMLGDLLIGISLDACRIGHPSLSLTAHKHGPTTSL